MPENWFDNELGFRDLGKKIPSSMENGKILRDRFVVYIYLVHSLASYYLFYKFTYNRNKIHRSAHPIIFFWAGLYIPYTYNSKINTFLFSVTRSKNRWINLVFRGAFKICLFSSVALLSQAAAYSVYYLRRAYQASLMSAITMYKTYKLFNDKEYDDYSWMEEIKKKHFS